MRYLTPRPRRQYQIMFSLLANGSATGKNQRCELKKKNLRSHIKLQLTLSVWLFLGSSSDHPPSIPCAQSRAPGQSWYPGTATPEYLDGSLVGDFGFDPLNLGEEPYKLKWYVQAELVHGRWAMLAVAGILFKDLLAAATLGGPAAATPWFKPAIEYYAPVPTLVAIAFFLFSWAEINRYQDIVNPGSTSTDPIFKNNKVVGAGPGYPGFDPLGYSKSPDFASYKLKEIKNGRLAMVAFAGFATQAAVLGKGPLESLGAHLADPWNTTVWANRAGEIPSKFF